jgi:hypothetical protein
MRTDPVSYRNDPLLRAIEAFLGESGLSATAFGMRAMNDPRFVHEMRGGREVRRATRARVAAYIRVARGTGAVETIVRGTGAVETVARGAGTVESAAKRVGPSNAGDGR